MKKITENALLFRVNQLNEKLAIIEAAQQQAQPQQGGVMQSIGNALGTAAGYATAVPRAVVDAGQYAYNHAGGAVDAVKNAASGAANAVSQGVQDMGQGMKHGWDNTDPAKMAGVNVAAPTQQGTGAKPVQAQSKPVQAQAKPVQAQAKPAQAKSDPAVLKIQQDLIAKGYPIKADGVMGPKTQQAMDWQAQSDKRDAGIKATNNMDPSKPAPAVPTNPAQKAAYDAATKNMDPNQPAAPAGAAAITPAFQSQQAPAPAAPAPANSGATQAQQDFKNMVTQSSDAWHNHVQQGNAAPAPAATDQAMMNIMKANAAAGMKESVSFKNEDSLARIVQLAKW